MILRMTKTALGAGVLVFTIVAAGVAAQDPEAARRAVIARGKSLELPTKYVPPPGEKIEHYASGYAKIMCTAVFVSGLDPAFAAENVGYFTAPYEERAKLGTPKIDRAEADRRGDDAEWHGAGGKARRQPGLRDAADRKSGRLLHAIDSHPKSA